MARKALATGDGWFTVLSRRHRQMDNRKHHHQYTYQRRRRASSAAVRITTTEVSPIQLSDKVRGLKRKFNQAVILGKEVSSPSSPDSHEKTLFNLSKSVWGSNSKKTTTKNTDIKLFNFDDAEIDANEIKNGHAHAEGQNGNKNKASYPYLSEVVQKIVLEDLNGALIRRAFLGIDKSKALVMEKKAKKFRTEEIEQGLMRIDLVKETVRFFLDGLRKSE